MRNVALVSLLSFVASGVFAQKSQVAGTYDPGIRPVTPESIAAEKAAEDAWFAHVQFLASDELKGRRTGTDDFLRAVEYVERQFKTIGLTPAGTNGYRQPAGFRSISTEGQSSSFVVKQRDGNSKELKVGSEVTLSPHIDGSGQVEAPAVFAGYGFTVPALGFDDVSGVDLHGKVAVVLAGSPASVHGPLKAYFRGAAERWKALRAAGAIGVVTISEPRRAGNGAGGQRPEAAQRAGFAERPQTMLSDPAVDALKGLQLSATLTPENAAPLFAGAPHTLDEIEQLARDGKDLPKFPLSSSLKAVTAVHETERFQSPNVVALLEGSDPAVKKEYLVLSAHLDHLGVGRAVDGDSIYNGAMDNASGIASLLETAKALVAGPRPRRSIIFLALTGEEEGELGSQYFARFPTVPRSQIIADINMDMYLPLFPLRFLEVQGLGESTLGNDARAAAQRNDIEVQFDKQPDENRFVRSDQASFVKYGIPGLAFKFGWLPDSPEQKTFNDWIKNRYHHPNDDLAQPISKEGAVRFDQVLLTLIRRVADAESRPSWYPESFFSTIPRS